MALIVLSVCAAAATGCHSGDDSVTAPMAPFDPLDQHDTERVGTTMLSTLDDFLVRLPDWLAGSPGGIGGSPSPATVLGSLAPGWDPSENCWTFSGSKGYDTPAASSHYNFNYTVQYLICRDWQREALAATGANINFELLQTGHSDGTSGTMPGATTDYRYDYIVLVTASDLDSLAHIDSSGGMEGGYSTTGSSGTASASYDATFTAALRLVRGVCPAGTVVVTIGLFTMTGTYDGEGGCSWVLKQGVTVVSTGTLSVACRSAAP